MNSPKNTEISYVVDTNVWLREVSKLQDYILQGKKLVVSGAVLRELDKHKSSPDGDLAFRARQATRFIKENLEEMVVDLQDVNAEWILGHEYSNMYADNRIVAMSKHYGGVISNDINVQLKAEGLGLDVLSTEDMIEVDDAPYTGFIEVQMSKESFDEFYSNRLHLNEFDLLVNQYLIVYDKNTGEALDSFRYADGLYQPINRKAFKSMFVDEFKARDEIQACAMDSVMNNKITILRGQAGTAKTQIAISYSLQQLQAGKIDRIIVFSNAMPVNDGSFYHGLVKGDLKQKLFSSSIGNILMSKLGSFEAIEAMMINEQLLILPSSDIRGFDTNGMNCQVILTEAQNWNVSLLQLGIQRMGDGENCKMIIEGDNKTQIDNPLSSGSRNGMRRASEVFRGWYDYGEIELRHVYRSELAWKAQEMTENH